MVHLGGLWYVSRGDAGQFDVDPLAHSVTFHVLVCLFLSRAHSRRNGDHMDSDPPSALLPYYVERNLRIDEFVRWAMGRRGGEDEPPGGNPNAGNNSSDSASTRLRSVIGPPGSGKSAFLQQLNAALNAQPPLIVFPVLFLKEIDSLKMLWEWWERAAAKVNTRRFPEVFHRTIDQDPVGVETSKLCQACGANPSIVLVDAFEEAQPSWQREIEQFLAQILTARNARIVLTRRDEYALEEARLRWEEEVLQLEPLSLPAEQIRRRLELAGAPAWSREDWEVQLDQLIIDADLTNEAREAVVRELMDTLTPNPYINLLLLRYKLQNLLPAEMYKQACLVEYLARVKLEAEVFLPLLKRIAAINELGKFTGSDYGGHGIEASELEQLMVAGIVNLISGTQSYQLEPAVVSLIN